MRFFYAQVDTVTCTIYLRMQCLPIARQLGEHTKKVLILRIPCFTQIHPTCIPVHGDHQSKLTLMSESLRNDGRVWVPKSKDDNRRPQDIPEEDRDYYLLKELPIIW